MHILLTGSLAFDRIMDFPGYFKDNILPDKIHSLNVAFNIERLEEKRGGTAGNIAYSLFLLGEQPKIIATAGKDFEPYMNFLKIKGAETAGIELHQDTFTAVAHIINDLSNNQITGFFMGAMGKETTATLANYDPTNTMVVLSPGNKADMLRYAAEAKDRNIRFVFDPGQTLNWLSGEDLLTLLSGAHVFIANDYEFEMVKKKAGLTSEQLLGMAKHVVVTLGQDGSRIHTGTEEPVHIPVCSVSGVKDPTGAGDAYRAGLLKGISAGLSLEQAGKIGAVAAAYAVEQYGTQEHVYTIEEFKKRYQDEFGELCPLSFYR